MAQLQTKGNVQFRTFQIQKEDIDLEKRTVKLSFSSEYPVERSWGFEILDHGGSSVRLGRLNTGAPFLLCHSREQQIGVVEQAIIKDRRGEAVVRFSRSSKGEEMLADVQDGIRSTVSVGYHIHKVILEKEENDKSTYRITDWEPFEISLEPTPADPTVGVGRSYDGQEIFSVVRENSNIDKRGKKRCVNLRIKYL